MELLELTEKGFSRMDVPPDAQPTAPKYRTPKVVFRDFPGPFHVHFPGPITSIFYVFPGQFN